MIAVSADPTNQKTHSGQVGQLGLQAEPVRAIGVEYSTLWVELGLISNAKGYTKIQP